MQTISEQLSRQLNRNALALWPDLKDRLPEVQVTRPTEKRHGDYASNLAMQLAPILKESPMAIAQTLVNKGFNLASLEEALVAQPGFINFTLKRSWLAKQPKKILAEGNKFGSNDLGRNERLHLEFISANPTGPLHLGNGRGGFFGDILGNVFSFSGYRVHREYYVNDIGKQVEILAESIIRRYFQSQSIPMEYPEYCYQGEYIIELAKKLKLDGVSLNNIDRAKLRIKKQALRVMLGEIKTFIRQGLKIKFDRFFLESEVHEKKMVDRVIKLLQDKKLIYEKDEALWMKTSQFGDDKDRVLRKKGGEQTYFLSDIAYLYDKFSVRRFPRAIILLGADHHGYVDRMQATMKALVWEGRLEIKIFQLVKLIKEGREVRMSKRGGNFVTLEEVVSDVSLDVARFFFLMVGMNTHMEFDLDLAKEKSDKNPVYYVQYAHARICSVIRNAQPLVKKKKVEAKLPLEERSADDLIKKLLEFPEIVCEVSSSFQVHELPGYSIELATAFHNFYTKVRVINQNKVHLAAYELLEATRLVLEQSLKLMGVSAPEKM
ncbi:MAG: arginine--tRNA ligase [bacterium]